MPTRRSSIDGNTHPDDEQDVDGVWFRKITIKVAVSCSFIITPFMSSNALVIKQYIELSLLLFS